MRYHDRVFGLAHGPSQRDAPAQRFPYCQPAVHGDYMWNVEQSRGGGAVHRHSELVAVDCVDFVPAKELHQAAHATGIDWLPQSEHLRGETDASEVCAQPAYATRRANGDDCMSAPP